MRSHSATVQSGHRVSTKNRAGYAARHNQCTPTLAIRRDSALQHTGQYL